MTPRSLPLDPLSDGIEAFGRRLRRGEITAEAATEAYLARIKALEPALGAFEHVAADSARATARAIDRLLAAGTDLGPLMGISVAIKDLLAVEGMPTTAGSNVDVQDLIGAEGSFVRRLKRAGCVILGKTKTVEFAIGGAGTNRVRGTPRNPWDMKVPRVPGGSSSGAAVAMAARLCALSIGSDTGGSVRGPAAFCGVFGLKTTQGLWPTDGVYPLSPSLDTVGLLTASAADAALATEALDGSARSEPRALAGLRLGRPNNHFFDNMDDEVRSRVETALSAMGRAGVDIVPIAVPEAAISEDIGTDLITVEFLSVLGRARFMQNRSRMDRDIGNRGASALAVTGDRYAYCLRQHQALCKGAAARFDAVDAWVMPTRPIVAPPISAFDDEVAYRDLGRVMNQNTRHVNLAGMCAVSIPLPGHPGALPVGLQIVSAPRTETKLLSMAVALEGLLGRPARPSMAIAGA